RVWTTVLEVVPAGAFWLAGFGRDRGAAPTRSEGGPRSWRGAGEAAARMRERRSGVPDRRRVRAPALVRHEVLRPAGLVVPPAPTALPAEEGTVSFSDADRFLV